MQQPEQKNVDFTVTTKGKQFYVTSMGNEFFVTPMEKVGPFSKSPSVTSKTDPTRALSAEEGESNQTEVNDRLKQDHPGAAEVVLSVAPPNPTNPTNPEEAAAVALGPTDAGAVEGAVVNPTKAGVAAAPVEAAGVEAAPPPNPPLPPVEAAVVAGIDAAVDTKPTKGLVKVAAGAPKACVEASKAGGAAEVVDAQKAVLAAPPKLKEDPIADEACACAQKRIMRKRMIRKAKKKRKAMMKRSRKKRKQAAVKRRNLLRKAAKLISNVERKEKIRKQITEKYMSKSEAEKKAKMEAAREAISHIDLIKVNETIAILEDDEAQTAHARKSEMSWEHLNGLFNEICNATHNEELKVLTQKYLTKRKEADEKNMEQQISVQDNDIILSVRTSDDMAKDILENLEKLAADKLTEEQYQAGDRMQVNNKKDELARLLKITAVRIEDVLEQVEDIAEARIEFYEALSQLDVLEDAERSGNCKEQELGNMSIRRFKRIAMLRLAGAIMSFKAQVEVVEGQKPEPEEQEVTTNIRVQGGLIGRPQSSTCYLTNDELSSEDKIEDISEDETIQPETTNDKLKTVIGGNPNVMLFEIHNVEVHNDILGREPTARARVEDVQSLRGQQESFDVIERAPVSDLENFNKEQQDIEKKLIEEEINELGDPDPKGDLTTPANCEAIYRNAQHMHHQNQCRSQAHTARQSNGGANRLAEMFTQLIPQQSRGKRMTQEHRRQTTDSHHYGAPPAFDGFKIAEDVFSLVVHKEDSTKPYVMQVRPEPFCKAMGLSEEHCSSPTHLEVLERNQLVFSSLKNVKDRKAYYTQVLSEQCLQGGVKIRQKEAWQRQKDLKPVTTKQMKSYMDQLLPVAQPDSQFITKHTVTAEIHHEPSRSQPQADKGISNKFPTIKEDGDQVRSAMVDSILCAQPSFDLQVGENIFCTQPKTDDMLCSVHSSLTALLNMDSVRHAASKSNGPIGDTLTRLATSTVIESEKSSLVESLAAECSSDQDGRIDQGQDAAIFMQTLLEKLCSEDPDANDVFNQHVKEVSTCVGCNGWRIVERHQLTTFKPNRSIAAEPKTMHVCMKGPNCADGEISKTTLLNSPDTIVQILSSRLSSLTYKRREEVPYQLHNGQYELKWGIVHLGTEPAAGHFITVITNPLDRQQCLLVDNGKVMWIKKEDFEKVVTQSYIIGYESVAPKTIPEPSSEEILNKMRAATKRTIRKNKALQSKTFLQGVKINIQLCWRFIDRSYNHEEAKKALTEMLRKKTYGNANLPLLTEEEEANRAAHQLYKRISRYEPKRWSVLKHIKSTLGLYDDKIIRNIEYIEKVCSIYKKSDGGCIRKEVVSVKKSRVLGTGVKPKKGAKYFIKDHAHRVEDADDGTVMWKCNSCSSIRCKPKMKMHHTRGRCAVLTRIDKHFQITPRNIPRGIWSNDTTQLKIIRSHHSGNKTRYTLVQGGEEFSFVIQTNSPTGLQNTLYFGSRGPDTALGRAWDGRGHSGDEKMFAAARECVMYKDQIDDDDNNQFTIWSLLGQLYSITERKEDETGVNLNVLAHPAMNPANRTLEKEIEFILVASEDEEGDKLKMIVRRPGRQDEVLTEKKELPFKEEEEDPRANESILRTLNNLQVDLYVNKAHLPEFNNLPGDVEGVEGDPLPNSLEDEFKSTFDVHRDDEANADEGYKTNMDCGPNTSDVGECSACKNGWTHECSLDGADGGEEAHGGDHQDAPPQSNVMFKFTNQGELLCWVNTATQVLLHTMPNIGRDLSRVLDQATDQTKIALPRMLLEIISNSAVSQSLNCLRDLLVPPPREKETGPALTFFENLVRRLADNAPASVVGFSNEQQRCEIVSQCSNDGCTEALLESSTITKSDLFVVNHKKEDDGVSAQASINRWISHKERFHLRTCGKGHSNTTKRLLKFNKLPEIFLVYATNEGGSFDQQTSIEVKLNGTTYRAVAVIHHIPGSVGHHFCSLWDEAKKQWLLIDDYNSEASWKSLYHFDNDEKAFKVGQHKLLDKLGVVVYKRKEREETIVEPEINGRDSRINFHTMMSSGQQVFQARNIRLDKNGMERHGNECYAIQAIRFLLSSPHIHNLLRNWPTTGANWMERYLRTLCYLPTNAICTNVHLAREMVPQGVTKFAEDNQQDSMEFIENVLATIHMQDIVNIDGEVVFPAPVPTDVLGYTEVNTTMCTDRNCTRNNASTKEELVYRLDITDNSVNGCLMKQLGKQDILDTGLPCDTCGIPNAIYHKTHNVSHVKKCIIIQLTRFDLIGKITDSVKVDKILSVGPFKGYVLTSAILHNGESKNCGHYTGLNYDASSGQWVFSNDAIADFVNENDAKEMLQKEGYILLYSKPDSLPEPLRAEEINRETVKETTRVPKGRVQQHMKPSSTRDQISTFKTDDRPIPINLPKMTHTSYLKNFQVHSPSEEELSARILPNQIDTNQQIIDPNDQLAIKLRDIFGHQDFRSVEQLEATRAVIAGHKDVLVIMSTGTIFFSMFVFKHICFRKWQITHLPIGCNGEK